MSLKTTITLKLLGAVLILAPASATADINAGNVAHALSQPNNSMIAAQPVIVGQGDNNDKNNGKNDNAQNKENKGNKDILITAPKSVVGGSGHQDSDISRYLGINY